MFFRRQRVVCIDPTWGDAHGTEFQKRICPNLPMKGAIYTVRYVRQGGDGGFYIRLFEIVNPDHDVTGSEPVFKGEKYRPLVEDDETAHLDNRVKLKEDA